MATDDAFFDPTRTSTQRSLLFLAAGALLGLATAGYALFTAKGTRLGGVPAEAVALVNQRPILRSDFMTQTAGQYSIPFAETSREQRENTLQSMIDEELLMQRGLEIDLPSYDPDVRNALVAGVELEVTAEVIAQQPTEAELQAYYQTHRSDYASEGVIQLRDLVVRSDAVHSRAALRAIAGDAAAEMREGQPLEAVMKRHGLVDSGLSDGRGHRAALRGVRRSGPFARVAGADPNRRRPRLPTAVHQGQSQHRSVGRGRSAQRGLFAVRADGHPAYLHRRRPHVLPARPGADLAAAARSGVRGHRFHPGTQCHPGARGDRHPASACRIHRWLVALTIAMIGAENVAVATHRPGIVAAGSGGALLLIAAGSLLGFGGLPSLLLLGAGLFAVLVRVRLAPPRPIVVDTLSAGLVCLGVYWFISRSYA